jgi:curved DNA-binding protein CbpA
MEPTMNIKECFDILELKLDAKLEQVKKAYKKLMIVFHPDKVQGDPQLKAIAERRAKEINIAREEVIA